MTELPSVFKKYNNTTHSSTKLNLVQTFKTSDEKEVYSNLQNKRAKQKPKYKLGQLVRTTDIKKVFGKGDSTDWSYIFIQQQKSYTTQLPQIESTVCPKDITRIP